MSKNTLIKNSFYKLLLNLFSIGVPLIIGPYALRTLGPTTMGEIYYTESIFNYFYIFSSFGLYQYGIRELSRCRNDKQKLKDLFSSLMVISVSASLFTIMIYIVFVNLLHKQSDIYMLLIIYSINLISNMIFVEWAVEALEDYRFITIKTIVIKVFYIFLLVSLLKDSSQGYLYALLFVFSTMFNNIVSFIYVIKKIKISFKNITILRHIKPLLLVVVMANINTLFTQLDRVMIGTFNSKDLVTYYSIPQGISGTFNALLLSFTAVMIPRLSNILNGYGDKEKYKSILNDFTNLLMYILLPICFGIFVMADKIIIIYGGYDYINSITTMRIFAVYLFTLVIEYIFTNQVLYVNNKEKVMIRFIIYSGLLNVILNTVLVFNGNLNQNTAIFTTLIANLLLILCEYIYSKNKMDLKVNIINNRFFLTCSICFSFFAIKYIFERIFSNLIVQVMITIIVCITIYFIYLVVSKSEIYYYLREKIIKK